MKDEKDAEATDGLGPLNPVSVAEKDQLAAIARDVFGVEDATAMLDEITHTYEWSEVCYNVSPVDGTEHQHPIVRLTGTDAEQAAKAARLMELETLRAYARGDMKNMIFAAFNPAPTLVKMVAHDDKVAITPMTDFIFLAHDAACFYKIDRKSGEKYEVGIPAKVAKLVKTVFKNYAFPQLLGVVDAPRWSSLDGPADVTTAKGYDPKSRYYVTSDFTLTRKAAPTAADVEAAKQTIHDLLGDFTYADDASYTNAVAMLLTTAMRSGMTTAPAFIITAGGPGSGKTLLTETIHSAVYGYAPTPAVQYGATDWGQKQLIMRLKNTHGDFIWYDEASGIDAMLRAVLTTSSGKLGDRVAYGDSYLEIDVKKTFVMTGNGIEGSLSYENGRRAVLIKLKPARGKEFVRKENELLDGAVAWRGEIHQAITTLVDNWLAKGRPGASGKMPSFNGWLNIVGGILEAAGYTDLLGNAPMASTYETAVGDFREWIYDTVTPDAVHGDVRAFTLDTLADVMSATPVDPELAGILDQLWQEAPSPASESSWLSTYYAVHAGNVKAVHTHLARALAHRTDKVYETVYREDGSLVRARKLATGGGGKHVFGNKTAYAITTDPWQPLNLGHGGARK